MLMREFQGAEQDISRLAAMGQFLLRQAKNTDAIKPMNVKTFVNLAHELGINLPPEFGSDQLEALAVQPPLNNVIDSIQNGEIIWKGSKIPQAGNKKMSVDQARKRVNQMAKRANKI